MTSLLQQAFRRASELPEDQQDALAALVLEELKGQTRWRELLTRSQDVLAQLADEGIEEDRAGETMDLEESLS